LIEKVLPGGILKDLHLVGTQLSDDFEVPAGRWIKFLYGTFGVTTSADVANRTYKILFKASAGSAVTDFLSLFEFTIAASLSRLLALGTSKPATDTVIDDSILLPSEVLLGPGDKIYVQVLGGEAADAWYLDGKYLEWIE